MNKKKKRERELNTTMPCSSELLKALGLLKIEHNMNSYEEMVWDMIEVYTDAKPILREDKLEC